MLNEPTALSLKGGGKERRNRQKEMELERTDVCSLVNQI
jgi:hypothetical protein